MRNLCVSITVALLLLALFFGGLAASAPGLSMIGFCGWSPAMLAIGYALARSGIRISIATSVHGVKPLSPRAAAPVKATQP